MATRKQDVDHPPTATSPHIPTPALPSSSQVLYRADGLVIALNEDDDEEPVSLYDCLGSEMSFTTTRNVSVLPEPSAALPHMIPSRSSPRPTTTSGSAKAWADGQVAFGSHRRMTHRRASDALRKSTGKAAQRPRSGSHRRRSNDIGVTHAPPDPHALEALLRTAPQHLVKSGCPGVILGDRTGQRRCDPDFLDVTMDELALFDAMATHASAAYRREEHRAQAGLFPAQPSLFATLEDSEDAAACDVYRAMQDEQLAVQAAEPGATGGNPTIGLLVSPPDIPAYLEENEKSEDVRREDEAMVDIWRYIYTVIRRSPSQRMCAYLQVSADDTRNVLKQVAENGMSCTLHRRGTEWWVAVVDQEDFQSLGAFVERRMGEVGVDQNGRRVLKLSWGADPLVVDGAVRTATETARIIGSTPQWPIQYTTGRLHFLVAWLDLEW